nr:ABC transporter permease [Desulfobacula sp.]
MKRINQERWNRFKANGRAYYSLYIFGVLFFVTLFSELIANEKPLLIYHDGELFCPLVKDYAETSFGGEFETPADYRDPYVMDLIKAKGWMIRPLIPFSYHTINYNLGRPAPSPPSRTNWLGTDDRGRDVLARLLYGFRISVLFGLTLTLFSSAGGITAGAVQGYY